MPVAKSIEVPWPVLPGPSALNSIDVANQIMKAGEFDILLNMLRRDLETSSMLEYIKQFGK